MNKLILGDNLEIMKNIETESIDLIYLDPPFFSNRNYEVIWGDEGEIRSFEDRWAGGIEHYIAWLNERVIQMHRILKPTGSIFLHCDYDAQAYIQVLILDNLFGKENFKNKITWKRADTHNDAKNQMPNVTDDIFYYSKSNNFTFKVQFTDHNPKTLKDWYKFLEFPDGTIRRMTKEEIDTQTFPLNARRFNADNMSNPSRVWKTGQYEYKGYPYPKNGWRYSLETMQELDEKGLLFFPKEKTGRIMRKRFLDEQKGAVLGDFWNDISQVRAKSSEIIGYPTQKPEALLQRIIEMASNEGDIVLDPFVGGGTTIAVADRLNRQWIGIDQSAVAIKVSDLRITKQHAGNLYAKPYDLKLRVYNNERLRNMDAFEFEKFIIEKFGGIPNQKQRGDLGIDGKMPDNTPIQVKQSDNIDRNKIDNFLSAIQRSDNQLFENNKATGKPVGYFIAFSYGRGAIEEVARLRNNRHIIIDLRKVTEILPLGNPPELTLTAKEIEQFKYLFQATLKDPTKKAFYSWDLHHNPEIGFIPEIILDKEGKQTRKFEPGEYQIAVEAVDDQGLDAQDKITINVT
jgi:DNA modification methylase